MVVAPAKAAVDVLAVGLLSCFVEGVIRESPVVLLAVSVSAVGFVEGGVLLSIDKGGLLCPRGRWAVGIVAGLEVFIFVFLVWCDEFGRSR